MPYTESFDLVVPSAGASVSDTNWQTVAPAHVKVWQDAARLLRQRVLKVGSVRYSITTDWSPLLRSHQQYLAAMQYIHRRGRAEIAKRIERDPFPRRSPKIHITVKANTKKSARLSEAALTMVHDVFLIMNMAAPGSCNFYRSKLIAANDKDNVDLSNYLFEVAALHTSWMTRNILDLETAINWYDSARNGASQLPANSTERALFAVLHLAKLDAEPLAVIWIFYALESLMQTKVGENFGALIRRLSLVFAASDEQRSFIRKDLRVLYDIRSAIVHGGFEVHHPMLSGSLDDRVDDAFAKLLKATDFGYAAIVGCLQRAIENRWREFCFQEKIVTPTEA